MRSNGIGRFPRTAAPALLAALALGLACGGCGGSSKPSASTSSSSASSAVTSTTGPASQSSQTTSASTASASAKSTTSAASSAGAANSSSQQSETAVEREVKNPNYVDPSITKYGKAAGSAETGEVESVIKRYYGALYTHQFATACAILSPKVSQAFDRLLARSRSSKFKSCSTVLPALLGVRSASAVASRDIVPASQVRIKTVRISGNKAFAVVGTPTVPAGAVFLPKVDGTWRMGSLLVTPAP